ncbi:hypothetical protein GCM10008938_47030 [Deinococcus roseus]|uniref:Tn3 transposase DDE domain-containing protein n=1 Tax=Deinococcus roseus TaxID=392414 RepID=A0ABQ2DH55_9DEIO|nr:hypothetical protein GCM10008938_47030 [Deinococcus roseus]
MLDALFDAEHLLQFSKVFRPISGLQSKLTDSSIRYVTTVFCYGCNLRATQAARSLPGTSRRDFEWINQHHITETALQEASALVVNAYHQFQLPKLWGSGEHASADGTKWEMFENNLMSEYHIRYGGYGGLGYYHVSDKYIALFSHFIPCGVWEAVYILDGMLQNTSDIQPDKLHADTQGQSAPVFGMAYLLGIELLPRIRNWQDLQFFRAQKTDTFENIGGLFKGNIDWELIETYLPDLLRIVVSIKLGRISAATVLKRLSRFNRKNKVYQAMRELGLAVRTIFLLRYISDPQLRVGIFRETNKSEQFNNFVQWSFFGGEGMVQTHHRDMQRKLIKYNLLVANCLVFHTVYLLTRQIRELEARGQEVPEEVLKHLNPYWMGHLNRFGRYDWEVGRIPDPLIFNYKG